MIGTTINANLFSNGGSNLHTNLVGATTVATMGDYYGPTPNSPRLAVHHGQKPPLIVATVVACIHDTQATPYGNGISIWISRGEEELQMGERARLTRKMAAKVRQFQFSATHLEDRIAAIDERGGPERGDWEEIRDHTIKLSRLAKHTAESVNRIEGHLWLTDLIETGEPDTEYLEEKAIGFGYDPAAIREAVDNVVYIFGHREPDAA